MTSHPKTRLISCISSSGTGAEPQDRYSNEVTSFACKASRSESSRLYIEGVPDMKEGLWRSIASMTGTAAKSGNMAAEPPT